MAISGKVVGDGGAFLICIYDTHSSLTTLLCFGSKLLHISLIASLRDVFDINGNMGDVLFGGSTSETQVSDM